jgi:hypothetical protein
VSGQLSSINAVCLAVLEKELSPAAAGEVARWTSISADEFRQRLGQHADMFGKELVSSWLDSNIVALTYTSEEVAAQLESIGAFLGT